MMGAKARSDDEGVSLEEDIKETSTKKRVGGATTEAETSASSNDDQHSDDKRQEDQQMAVEEMEDAKVKVSANENENGATEGIALVASLESEPTQQKPARRGRKKKSKSSTNPVAVDGESVPEALPTEVVEATVEGEENDASSSAKTLGSKFAEGQRKKSRLMLKKMDLEHQIGLLLSSPDPPFDHESEMEKVVDKSGLKEPAIGGLHDDGDVSADAVVEHRLEELESDMYQAVEEEDFTKAAACRAELDKLHVDECSSVLQANSVFYRAFSEKDLGAMEELWLRDSTVLCIHPSHFPISGTSAILESWKTMFNSADATFQRNIMEPTNIRISVRGTTAVVTCDEEVYTRRFVRGRRRRTELVNKLTATNIFRKVDGRWYMVHHHSSWHASSPAGRRAMGAKGDEPLVPERRPSLSFSQDDSEETMRRRIQMRSRQVNRLQGLGIDATNPEDNGSRSGNKESDPMPLTLDSVLGIPPAEALSGSKKSLLKKSGDEKATIKRVFMGSLGDLLSGGLSDVMNSAVDGTHGSDEDEDDEEKEEFLFDNEDDEDNADDNDADTPRIVIRASTKELPSDARPEIKLLGKGKSTPPILRQTETSESHTPSKDTVRQNCIVALRTLASRGAITEKQKRILLTDIIMSSAKGESSMVEVAYGLLCGEGEDRDAADDEFADQCRVFAMSLPEFPQPPRRSVQ